MLSSDEFAQWSTDYVAFLHVTTRVETDKHQGLLKEKGFRGFPSLAFMDEAGSIIAKHAGPRTLDGLNGTATAAGEYIDLRAKAASGDATAKAALFVKDLQIGRYGYDEGTKKLAEYANDLPAATVAQAEATLVDLQIQGKISALRAEGLERGVYMTRYAALMSEFFTAGRMPAGRGALSVVMGAMNHARNT